MEVQSVFILLSCFFAISITCPLDWGENNGMCYQFSSSAKSWYDAESDCKTMGAHLVTDDSQATHDYLKKILGIFYLGGKRSYWTGASDFVTEGVWKWMSNNQAISTSTFSAWGPDQPDGNITANCMAFKWYNHTLNWVDSRCTSKHDHHYYICEKSLASMGA